MQDEVRYQRVEDVPGLVLSVGHFANFSFERHYHLDCHIGIVTEGIQRQCYEGRTEHVGQGCIALMPPGVIHDGTGDGDAAYTLKTFRVPHEMLGEACREFGSTDSGLPATTIVNVPLANQLNTLHSAMRTLSPDPLAIQAEWLALLHQLFVSARALASDTPQHRLSAIALNTLRDYCMSHLADKITLEELAALCHLERFQFLRQFKRTVGMTPHAWLLRMRLEQACSLLALRAGSLTDIAQEVGFFDQSHFNRAFRQAFGVPPSRY